MKTTKSGGFYRRALIHYSLVLSCLITLLPAGFFGIGKWNSNRSLNKAILQLESDITWMKEEAMTRQSTYGIVFEAVGSRYSIFRDFNRDQVWDSNELVLSRNMEKSYPGTFVVSMNNPSVTPAGQVDRSNIVLVNAGGMKSVALSESGNIEIAKE